MSVDAAVTAAGEEHAALALREAAVLLAPIARWLLRNGVGYGAVAEQLKTVFVDAARAELARSPGRGKLTFSSLSTLSGVHRKDVRAIESQSGERGSAAMPNRGIPLASEVYTRWVTARRYRLRSGEPKPLPRSGAGITFESLARELSQDVHPRTVLDELLRLGLVRLDGNVVTPLSAAFTPSRQLEDSTALFAANVGDHIAAAVENLSADKPPFLEYAVFADELGAESVAMLQKEAVAMWAKSFEAFVASATERVAADAALPTAAHHRLRFGTYFYSEPQALEKQVELSTTQPAKTARQRKKT